MDDHIYKINVSGKIYEIKHKILIKIPYFLEFINSDEPICFVERSSIIFDHVLAYAIDTLHPYPSKYFYELDYYGLIYKKDIYKINMLGKIYQLKSDILMKIPYFVKCINDINNRSVGNSSIELFVDRSPLLFDHILNYTVDNSYPYPLEYYSELDFYGILYKRYNLSNSIIHTINGKFNDETYTIQNKLDNIENKFSDIIIKLDEIKFVDGSNKKICKVSDCEKYVVGEDTNYCYEHGECIRCYNDASRSNDFLCSIHQDY
jgi:hypothetical protein